MVKSAEMKVDVAWWWFVEMEIWIGGFGGWWLVA